jgi:predicted O-methyltransferase YrrM
MKESGRLTEAERAYRAALAYDPRSPDSHLQLGNVLKLQGKIEDAKGAYVRAVALDPSATLALDELRAVGWSAAATAELIALLAVDEVDRSSMPQCGKPELTASEAANDRPADANAPIPQANVRFDHNMMLSRHDNAFLTLEQTAVDRRFEMRYLKTYDFPGAFINTSHSALVANIAETGMIDLGIEGWLLPADALKLYELVYFCGGDVLELGTYKGLSTAVAAQASYDAAVGNVIVSIDLSAEVIEIARANLDGRPGAERVYFFAVDGGQAVRDLGQANRIFDFVFIDHSHAYDHVYDVCRSLEQVVKLGGFCLFHDFNDPRNSAPEEIDYGVYQGVLGGLDPRRFEFWGIYGCTGLFRRVT